MLSKLEWALLGLAWAHVLLAPHVKVEESFSLHAVRDIIQFGVDSSSLPFYDHLDFPGAVPRSFVGPLVLSVVLWPFLRLGKALNLCTTELRVQILLRLILATLSVSSMLFLTRRVRDTFGKRVQDYTLLITASQFHLLFWCGRTLPNMFAFPLVQVMMAMSIGPWPRRTKKGKGSIVEILEGFATLTMAAIIMRLELVAFILPAALQSLFDGTTGFVELVLAGIVAAVLSLGLTVGVDSYFWGKWIWPEGSAIMFNVVQGHASDWGIQPYHHYFTSALPRLLHFALPLSLIAISVDRRARSIGLPAYGYIILLSFLGHKEWRFFVYVIPSLNVCAAAGLQCLQVLVSKRAKMLALYAMVATNLLIGGLGMSASMSNYPGGEAMVALAKYHSNTTQAIHIDAHAAMTGASLFNHPYSSPATWYISPVAPHNWSYDRSENLTEYTKFDWLITGSPDRHEEFEKVESFEEFRGFDWRGLSMRREESVWIMRRRRN